MVSWRILKLAGSYQAGLLALALPLLLWLWPQGALATLGGGVFAGLNFWALKALVQRGFSGPSAKAGYMVLLGLKTLLALAVMTALLVGLRLHPVGFAVGLATMLLGFGLAVVHVLARPQTTAR